MSFKVGDRITRKTGRPEIATVMVVRPTDMGLLFDDREVHKGYSLDDDRYAYFCLINNWRLVEPPQPYYENTTDYYRAITCDE